MAGSEGGGIWGISLTLMNSTIMSNAAGTSGGGIYGGGAIANSTVSGNIAQNGGGIHDGAFCNNIITIANSTISGNRASGDGGGIYYSDICNTKMRLSSVTVTNNASDSDGNETGNGGGILSSGSMITLANTIVAGNFDNSPIIKYPECDGTIGSEGYNLILTVSPTCLIVGDTTGNIIGVNPNLAPLADNGGPTPTHALWPGNPAVDNGDPNGCVDDTGISLTVDQRGYARSMDGNSDGFAHCDIGAFELGLNTALAPILASTIIYTDAQGNPTSISVPTGAVTETATLVYSSVYSETPPAGYAFSGHAFALDVYKNGMRLDSFTFQKPITITIKYSDADINGLDEAGLTLMYLDGTIWVDAATTCTPPSSYVRDLANNGLATAVCHLSDFALFGPAIEPIEYRVYLPIVLRNR